MECETSILIILSSTIIKVKGLGLHPCYSPITNFILTNAPRTYIFFFIIHFIISFHREIKAASSRGGVKVSISHQVPSAQIPWSCSWSLLDATETGLTNSITQPPTIFFSPILYKYTFSLSSKFPDELIAMKLTSGTWKIFLSTLLQHDWCLPPLSPLSLFTSPLLDPGVSLQSSRNGKGQCSWLLWIWCGWGRKDSYWWYVG